MKKILLLLVSALFMSACNAQPAPQQAAEQQPMPISNTQVTEEQQPTPTLKTQVAEQQAPMPVLSTQKALVVYFSATGTTKKVAENLAKALHADIYEIKPAVPYTSADLNWRDKKSRSSVEMSDPSSRPEMAENNISVKEYDVIYLGFPIWWGTAPHIVKTFLEKHDFSNKKIILFATSGSSGMGNTAEDLKPSVATIAQIKPGKVLNGNPSMEELKYWAETLE